VNTIDGVVLPLVEAGAWAVAHPGYYLNDWLRIKATDGFRTAQIDYWMKDKPRSNPAPRWNLLDALMNRANER